MLYKIIKITDLDGKDKTTEDYINRVGRIIYLDKDFILEGFSIVMISPEPRLHKSILTSHVTKVINAEDGIIIYTENSIYFLVEKEIADWYEEQEYQMNVEMASHFDENGNPI